MSQGAKAGNVDAQNVTMSFGSSSAAAVSVSTTHSLGRVPIGFDVAQVDGPIQIYSDTANNWASTKVYFSALVWGAATKNQATVRIW
jgi:hypothetical protein